MGIESFDRVPLLFGPSPVHRLERLSEHLGGAVEIWAKREDCNSGLAYGGNKVRKLEYLAADALAQGCDTLVSIGGVQSNHTRQVAAVAARLGLDCVLVQERWVEWPDAVYDKVGNILLSRIMGADVRLDAAGFDIGIRKSWEEALASVEESGGKPYPIPAGASDHPLGGLGFARWADEVAEQERELDLVFDTVVVCSVTGSTQAGMIAGFAAQETERAVVGIDGSATVEQTWAQIARIARFTADAIGLGRDLDDSEIVLLDEWHAGTYGIPDEKTHRRDPPLCPPRGNAHGPGVRGEVDGRADRPRALGPHRAGVEGSLRPPGRPAGVERLRRRFLSRRLAVTPSDRSQCDACEPGHRLARRGTRRRGAAGLEGCVCVLRRGRLHAALGGGSRELRRSRLVERQDRRGDPAPGEGVRRVHVRRRRPGRGATRAHALVGLRGEGLVRRLPRLVRDRRASARRARRRARSTRGFA